MFATATQTLRDRLELRRVALVALLASGAFALQLALLAGTVASPLGGAIADLDRIPAVQGAPAEALAREDAAVARPRALGRVAQLRSGRPAPDVARQRTVPPDCAASPAKAN